MARLSKSRSFLDLIPMRQRDSAWSAGRTQPSTKVIPPENVSRSVYMNAVCVSVAALFLLLAAPVQAQDKLFTVSEWAVLGSHALDALPTDAGPFSGVPSPELLRGDAERPFNAPTACEAPRECALLHACLAQPFGLSHRAPVQCQQSARSTVVGLGSRVSPSTVGFAVGAVVVDPVDAVALRRRAAHIGKELLEGRPLWTDSDAPSAPSRVVAASWILAPTTDLAPSVQFLARPATALLAVSDAPGGYELVRQAPATIGVAFQQYLHDRAPDGAAVAATHEPPQYALSSYALNRDDPDHGPSSKPLPDAIFSQASSSHVQPSVSHSVVFTLSEWAVLGAHAADIAATQRCLGSGKCHELNPWLARYSSPVTFTAAKVGVAGLQLWAVRKLKPSHPKLATLTNYAIAAAFTSIAIRNERIGK